MEWGDFIGLGITYDMLLEALSEAGGTTSMSGHYTINEAIKQGLKKRLNIKCF
jgi:hypothetical protein